MKKQNNGITMTTVSSSKVTLSKNYPSYQGFLCIPEKSPAPGLVLIQEIFGVNHVMQDVCKYYSSLGYVTLCPDLFWRFEPGIELDDRKDEDWAQAGYYYQNFSQLKGIEDLKIATNFLRQHETCNGKVGTIGFCLGGKMAYLMATESDSDCNVSYYGVGIERELDLVSKIKHPYLSHLAEKDKFVTPQAQEIIIHSFKSNPQITAIQHKNVDHAFARIGGAHYDAKVASEANKITEDFLKLHL